MPELPEVEITTQSLIRIVGDQAIIHDFTFFRKNLRNTIPIKKIKSVEGEKILQIYRRAKFIIFEMESGLLLSHLGMTGSWRLETGDVWNRRKHDHVVITINEKMHLVYNDARRFGEFDFTMKKDLQRRFSNFGVEPLDSKTDYILLTNKFKKLESSIKAVLMNQKYLVGVGNIYANEALFRAGIKPQKSARKVTFSQYQKLWIQVRQVLTEAIKAGGSSIQDFRNGYDKKGDFQNHFLIYGRKGIACFKCQEEVKSTVVAGRATYWCKNCQT